jgi:CRP/FNR family transcriptional regulator
VNKTYSDIFSRQFPFWNKLTPVQQQELCQNTSEKHLSKGELLYNGGDCAGLLLVRSGQLRVYIMSEDGRDITLYRPAAGSICILSASCVLDAITFEVYIDAEEDTDVLQIHPETFRRIADENIYMKNFAYEQTAARFSDVMWAMQQILFMRVDKRLAVFLCGEIEKSHSNYVRMTHEQIARCIGSAREVVTRMLKYFAEEGIVELSRGEIRILNLEKLKKLAG